MEMIFEHNTDHTLSTHCLKLSETCNHPRLLRHHMLDNNTPKKNIGQWIVKAGNLAILQWLDKHDLMFNFINDSAIEYEQVHNFQWNITAVRRNIECIIAKTIEFNQYEMFQWLVRQFPDCIKQSTKQKLYGLIGKYGRLEFLKWFMINDSECFKTFLVVAICQYGHIELLDWLYKNDVGHFRCDFVERRHEYMTDILMRIIACRQDAILAWWQNKARHYQYLDLNLPLRCCLLDIRQYATLSLTMMKQLISQGCWFPVERHLHSYVMRNSLKTLQWLVLEHQHFIDRSAMILAFKRKDMDIIQWFHDQLSTSTSRHPTIDLSTIVVPGDSIEVAIWASQHGYLWDVHTISTMNSHGHLQGLQYAHKQLMASDLLQPELVICNALSYKQVKILAWYRTIFDDPQVRSSLTHGINCDFGIGPCSADSGFGICPNQELISHRLYKLDQSSSSRDLLSWLLENHIGSWDLWDIHVRSMFIKHPTVFFHHLPWLLKQTKKSLGEDIKRLFIGEALNCFAFDFVRVLHCEYQTPYNIPHDWPHPTMTYVEVDAFIKFRKYHNRHMNNDKDWNWKELFQQNSLLIEWAQDLPLEEQTPPIQDGLRTIVDD
jgi:hypothetical protein